MTDEEKAMVEIGMRFSELDRLFRNLETTYQNRIADLGDEIADGTVRDRTPHMLLRYAKANSDLCLVVENRKHIRQMKENMEAIGNTFRGHIPAYK